MGWCPICKQPFPKGSHLNGACRRPGAKCLTFNSYVAMAKPSEAAEPASPIKCPDPTFEANNDAPT